MMSSTTFMKLAKWALLAVSFFYINIFIVILNIYIFFYLQDTNLVDYVDM